jgi:DNA-binding NarL/FixJ family response regulator
VKNIKILLADDHRMVREGLKLMLTQQKSFIPNITQAETGTEVLEKVDQEDFDIYLLDINMPGQDGISIARHIKKIKSDARIIIISMHEEEYVIDQAISAGAMGYLLKNVGLEEMIKAIETVYKYQNYYCNEVAQKLLKKSRGKATKMAGITPIFKNNLTDREMQVLKMIADEQTNMEIAKTLSISKRTVDYHRNNLLHKLQVKNTTGLVKYAIINGLVDT